MVFDCETATLPFANDIARGDAEKKKRIAIARPLIYDMGWTITNRKGEILEQKQYLIAETFSVPAVFNTAYYSEKRPLYLEKLLNNETVIKPWNEVAEIFMNDLQKVDAVGAYNSMFDFKKAIPFTELYIKKLYSPDYYDWEKIQKKLCWKIANEPYKKNEEKEFDAENFFFRGENYPLFDLWGLATMHLLNNVTYKKKCLENDMLTASGTYFKTSAEASYRYLKDKYDFDEAHTALEDAIIETYILSQIAKRSAITIGIIFFPFRELGTTNEFVLRKTRPDRVEITIVIEALEKGLEGRTPSAYTTRIENLISELEEYLV
jgi:hypothetical protein